MDDETRIRVVALLERQQSAAAELRAAIAKRLGRDMVDCPACGLRVRDDRLVEHARSYDDDSHRVLEVMAS